MLSQKQMHTCGGNLDIVLFIKHRYFLCDYENRIYKRNSVDSVYTRNEPVVE